MRLSVRTVSEHASSHSHGTVQVITRHTTSVTPGTSRWHCPYRKTLQQTLRWSQAPSAQVHVQEASGSRLQSM